jgi:hypothetical protein
MIPREQARIMAPPVLLLTVKYHYPPLNSNLVKNTSFASSTPPEEKRL